MNMEIVQICDITLAVKFALKTKTNIEYFVYNSEHFKILSHYMLI